LATGRARRPTVAVPRLKRILLGSAGALVLGAALATVSSPAAAMYGYKHKVVRRADKRGGENPFAYVPKGPLQAVISIDQQRLYLYSDGVDIADAAVATGVPGHLTPLGVFSVIERDRYHHSNIYDNAPMPYMERITWSGVALHEGPGVGHEASHGCIRMPQGFAAWLWRMPTMGMGVIIAGPKLRPTQFADPHLFVHKTIPPRPIAELPKPIETAQSIPPGTSSDAVSLPLGGLQAAPAVNAPQPVPAAAANSPAPMTAQMAPRSPPAGAAPAAATAAPAAASPNAASPNAPSLSAAHPDSASAADVTPMPAEAAVAAREASPGQIDAPISVDDVPLPPPTPRPVARGTSGPIAIFISRKLGKIFVRQDFTPLFSAPVKIADAGEPLGTHVFTALDYLPDHSTFRWDVVSLPAERTKIVERWKYVRDIYGRWRRQRVKERVEEPVQGAAETPQQALDRIQIPPDVINQISQLIVPGSSLIVTDHGFGPETGRGTNFIVITH
jgi:hypothetical protein